MAAALLAVLFGVAWGTPLVQATCLSAGSHCGSSVPAEHCDREQGTASAVCVTHHASQDLRVARIPSVEPLLGDGAAAGGLPSGSAVAPRSISPFVLVSARRTVRRAVRSRAHVGVWLE